MYTRNLNLCLQVGITSSKKRFGVIGIRKSFSKIHLTKKLIKFQMLKQRVVLLNTRIKIKIYESNTHLQNMKQQRAAYQFYSRQEPTSYLYWRTRRMIQDLDSGCQADLWHQGLLRPHQQHPPPTSMQADELGIKLKNRKETFFF